MPYTKLPPPRKHEPDSPPFSVDTCSTYFSGELFSIVGTIGQEHLFSISPLHLTSYCGLLPSLNFSTIPSLPGRGPHLAPIRQGIESIFWTCKDILTLERHGARTLRNLRVRLAARFAALAAAIALNHEIGRPSRSLAPYTA